MQYKTPLRDRRATISQQFSSNELKSSRMKISDSITLCASYKK